MNDTQSSTFLESKTNHDMVSSFVLQTIKNVVSADVDVSTKFANIVIDSLSYVELVVALEEKFNIEFDDDMLVLETFTTLGDLIAYVEEKMQNEQ